MRRKCRKSGEITVMELSDVALQTPAMATTGTTRKKRRRFKGDGNSEFRVASSTNSMTSRSRRILLDHRRLDESQCLSPNLDPDDDMSCCSSSIGSSEKKIIQLPDLEGESIEVEASTHLNFRESRRETTPSSEPEDLDSTSRPSEANSRRRSTVEKMPTEAELEEFFAAAEKKVKKQFAKKYNYDIVKDEPLEGRYQWVRLKP
ncbi:cyclin-dependent kinase inhibitor 7-like isoform X1 [Hibiscus syriacus]|uniref:cyclin-dependent kinase inhibitor 7-like isoform X1 n=1 Tax=Hibiscus syriacus TaxID=106335 RepID=UPI001924B6F1|nr:cyclin-dependent kinase inhibitor 7-like isoform X1 [Hibiscus syriacus]